MTEISDYNYFDTVYFNIKEFLLEYEKLPCLWDKHHEHFKDRRERSKSEEILGEKLDIMDLKTLRRKIRSVRGTYNTEIRKIKMSLETEGDVYVPKLSWFPIADKFLRVTTELSPNIEFAYTGDVECTPKKKMLQKLPRESGVAVIIVPNPSYNSSEKLDDDSLESSNMETIEREKLEEEYDDEYEEIELDDQDNEDIEKNKDNDSTIDYENFQMYCDPTELLQDERERSSSPEYNKSKKRRKTDKGENLSDVVRYLKDVACASENEFAAFGRSVGVQLQNMPLRLAVQLQADIQAHITQTRLDYLKKYNN